MATHIFPGVYTTIIDKSFFMQQLPGVIAYICIASEEGPDNVPRMTTSVQDLIETYGRPNPARYGQGWYVAKNFLEVTGSLYVMRVLKDPNDVGTAMYGHVALSWNDTDELYDAVYHTNVNRRSQLETLVENNDYDVIFYPNGRGEYANNLGIRLVKSADYSMSQNYSMDIYKMDNATGDWYLKESFEVSFDQEAQDVSGESLYIETVLDMYSTYMKVAVRNDIDKTRDFSVPFLQEVVPFQNGTDGDMYTVNGYVDWNKYAQSMAQGYSGALTNPITDETNAEVTDPECLEFSIVFDAGYPTLVKNSIVNLCDVREDCFAFVDNLDNKTSKQALDSRKMKHTYNTFRAALYEQYTKIQDEFTGKYIWMTPIYHVARCFARTEKNFDLWWPFFGLNRGSVSGVVDVRYKLVGNYKNDFKLNQINPFIRWNHGIDSIWGNWTTQRRPSALSFIHVVLTLQYIKRVLEWNLKFYIGELNDQYTWILMKSNVDQFLADLKSRRALEWFAVEVGASDYERRQQKCHVNINLRVVGAIEVIEVALNVY